MNFCVSDQARNVVSFLGCRQVKVGLRVPAELELVFIAHNNGYNLVI